MATNKRSIGGDGLEQGGANLGNSYDRTNNNTPSGGSEIIPDTDVTPEDFETAETNEEEDDKDDEDEE